MIKSTVTREKATIPTSLAVLLLLLFNHQGPCLLFSLSHLDLRVELFHLADKIRQRLINVFSQFSLKNYSCQS